MKTTKIGSVAIAFALLATVVPAFAENDLPADHFSYGLSKESQWHSATTFQTGDAPVLAQDQREQIVMGDTATTFQTGDAPVLAQDQPAQIERLDARVERQEKRLIR